MNRIFVSISIVSNVFLAVTYILGWAVGGHTAPSSSGGDLALHFLCGVGALILAILVHAIVLTYFMGTGRWIEETSAAYRLGPEFRDSNIRLKYRTLPGMIGCIGLLIVVGGSGAAADPGAALDFPAASTVHMLLASAGLLLNVTVTLVEYDSIRKNGELVGEILGRVEHIRRERGLPSGGPAAAGSVEQK